MTRPLSALLLLAAVTAPPAPAQIPWLRSYYLHVGLWSEANPFSRGGLGHLQRLRFMVEQGFGPASAELAYEHLFTYTARAGGGASSGLAAGLAPAGGEWLDLQWSIADDDHVSWRHRLDRLNFRVSAGERLDFSVGRQTISWATTLLLTPADPFVPFDPADPFREYRAGVDAIRLRGFPGPLSEAELVFRPADTPVGKTVTFAARGRGVLSGWEYSGWAGVLHDQFALGVGASGAIGRAAVRLEIELRDENGDLVARRTVGLDTRVPLFDRDLYMIFEYQQDDFGASGADDLVDVLASDAFARGEMQTLGENVVAAQGAYQIHPLVGTDLLVLWNLNDLSALFAPGVSYSVSEEVSARAGVFMGLGSNRATFDRPLPSEFGLTPTILYGSLSVFF